MPRNQATSPRQVRARLRVIERLYKPANPPAHGLDYQSPPFEECRKNPFGREGELLRNAHRDPDHGGTNNCPARLMTAATDDPDTASTLEEKML